MNTVGKILWVTMTALVFLGYQSVAQSSSEMKLVNVASQELGDFTLFNFDFETEEATIKAEHVNFMTGYESLELESYAFVDVNGSRVLKVKGYMVDKKTDHKLRWVGAIDYEETPREMIAEASNIQTPKAEDVFSEKYIQFGAFDKLDYAKSELANLEGFDVKLIQVNNQYKLVAPYSKDDFRAARKKYASKQVWPVKYKAQSIVSAE